MSSDRTESPPKGFVKIRRDHVRRLGVTRVQVGGLFGEKKTRKDRRE